MTTPAANRQAYRPEIQGIRTIGALLVAAFHIWGGRVSGGVDVFFVISGFLITGSLYREIQRGQAIDVTAFWGRIAKRIAPMAYVVLALTLLAALLWLPQVRQQALLSEIFYSAFHLENIKLMMNSVDYLDRDEAPSPVQQFWALSVQVQFYAVWPFLLLVIAAVARKLRAGATPYIIVLSAVFFASLAYSLIETYRDPSPAYFNTLARVWEFAMGGLVAVALPHLSPPPTLRAAAGWLGLLAIVSCGFIIPPTAHFPGYVALWPTLGAVLVLLSGGSGPTRFGADRILASKPLVAMGEFSFSFYLWHWPVLIFYLIVSGRTHLGPLSGMAVIAIALCGAYCTNRWLEQPILQSSIGKKRAWHVHAMATAFALPVLATAGIWFVSLEAAESRQREAMERRSRDYPGGAVPMSLANAVTPGIPIYPTTAAVRGKHPNRCQQSMSKPEVTTCNYGVEEGTRKTIALVGGSHSEHWLPALEQLALQQGWKIVAVTKSGCPFIVNSGTPTCRQWNEDVHATLLDIRPDAVFTISTRRGNVTSGAATERVPPGYLKQWKRLAKSNISVIAVRDSARMRNDVLNCVEKNSANVAKCGMPRKVLFLDVDPATQIVPKPENVSFIDLTDRFCDDEICLPVNGNMLIYRDAHHLTSEYSRTLAGPLGERMRQVRPDLFTVGGSAQAEGKRSVAGMP